MADAGSAIFNKKAADKLRSPDDLDKYVRVTNPSVWVVLGACIALLVGLLAWGIFGSVTTSVSTTGVVENGRAMCFLGVEDTAMVSVGNEANVGGETMKVSEVSALPYSHEELTGIVSSDYLVSTLAKSDWTYQIKFDGDTSGLAEGVPLTVSITVERMAPISLILGGHA